MGYIDILKQDAEAAYNAATGLFKMVDENGLDWNPSTGNNWLNVGQLLKHCSEACGTTVKGFVTGDWGFPTDVPPEEAKQPTAESMATVSNIEEALKLLEEDKKLAFEMFDKAGEERLINERSAPPWGGPERTLFQHCHEMIGHLQQHKGQLFYYLKLQGKDVNTMHLWGVAPS